MKDRCENCKYFRGYIKLENGEWKKSGCCIMYANDENFSVVYNVDKNDLCECFIDK